MPWRTLIAARAFAAPETATSTPARASDDILTRIKTLITYLSNTALRQSVPKEEVIPETPAPEAVVETAPQPKAEATTTPEKATE